MRQRRQSAFYREGAAKRIDALLSEATRLLGVARSKEEGVRASWLDPAEARYELGDLLADFAFVVEMQSVRAKRAVGSGEHLGACDTAQRLERRTGRGRLSGALRLPDAVAGRWAAVDSKYATSE